MRTTDIYNNVAVLRIALIAAAMLPSAAPAQENGSTDTLRQETEATAQVDFPVTDTRLTHNVRMAGAGSANILDTYLSPEKYRGTEVRYLSHTTRPTRCKGFTQILMHQGDVSLTHNRADNNNEIAGMYNFQYAWRYNWDFLGKRLHVEAGAGIDLNLGFIYNTRNTNNPAQAKASLNIAPSAAAVYNFSIRQRPFAVRYELAVPLAGVMFSPNYGQSYYEIFNEGNYDHNAVATGIASAPSLRQMVSLDFPLGHTWFRVGYLGDYQQAKVNNLKYHSYSHMLMIGIVRHFSVKKYRP